MSFTEIARSINEDPDALDELVPSPAEEPETAQEVHEVSELLRPGMYALLGLAADGISKIATQERWGDRQCDASPRKTHWQSAEHDACMGCTLHMRYATGAKAVFARRGDPALNPVLDRLDEVVAWFYRHHGRKMYESSNELMAYGIGTSLGVTMYGQLAVVRTVQRIHSEASNEQIAAVSRRSKIIPRTLAAVSLDHIADASLLLQRAAIGSQPGTKPDEGILIPRRNKEGEDYIRFAQAIRDYKSPSNPYRKIGDHKIEFKLLSCPGLLQILGRCAVEDQWDLAADIGERGGHFTHPDNFAPVVEDKTAHFRLNPNKEVH